MLARPIAKAAGSLGTPTLGSAVPLLYRKGLLLPGDRKRVEHIAIRVCPNDVQQRHHFVSASAWSVTPLQQELFPLGSERSTPKWALALPGVAQGLTAGVGFGWLAADSE